MNVAVGAALLRRPASVRDVPCAPLSGGPMTCRHLRRAKLFDPAGVVGHRFVCGCLRKRFFWSSRLTTTTTTRGAASRNYGSRGVGSKLMRGCVTTETLHASLQSKLGPSFSASLQPPPSAQCCWSCSRHTSLSRAAAAKSASPQTCSATSRSRILLCVFCSSRMLVSCAPVARTSLLTRRRSPAPRHAQGQGAC